MATSDSQVGRNVAQARGKMTQQQLADAMRERGWKWSQSTVWAIERGERPLRLSEADDLADVLSMDANGVQAFLRDEDYAALHRTLGVVAETAAQIEKAATLYFGAQQVLARAMDGALFDPETREFSDPNGPGPIEEIDRGVVRWWLTRGPDDMVREERLAWERGQGESLAPVGPFEQLLQAHWRGWLGSQERDRDGEHPEAP